MTKGTPSPCPVRPVRLPPDQPLSRLVSTALWLIGLLWLIPMMMLMMLVALVVPPDRTDWLSRVYCRGQLALLFGRWRAIVDPGVDPARVYMFCQNHVNLLDHVTLYPATPHFKQGVELVSHFRIPVYGWFMKQRGTIGVRRGTRGSGGELRAAMHREVAAGHSLLVFPEGTRTTTGRVGRFRTGTLHLARDLGIPVVPVAVTGMYETLRKGSWLLRPGHTVTVHVLAPIETAGLTDAGVVALTEEVEHRIGAVVDAYWLTQGRDPLACLSTPDATTPCSR